MHTHSTLHPALCLRIKDLNSKALLANNNRMQMFATSEHLDLDKHPHVKLYLSLFQVITQGIEQIV
jgi:hypothetical protein